ncbi:MAG: CDP-alcohol phosphatidyltransferase family protein [Actinomycetota bacterium]|nr:CDP-alcohol phosphatidyltransferase family protein [Actinomycetota bacterium]
MDVRYLVTRHLFRRLSVPAASLLVRARVTPIQVTWFSAALAFAAATAFGLSAYPLGAGLAFLSIIADCIDGDLARLSSQMSRRGAFLDSVLDRWMDAALILGLGYSDLGSYGAAASLALVGSMLTSYTRARAQSLGADCPDGIGGRDTRMVVLILCALFGQIGLGLVVVAVLGFITSIHRMGVAARALSALDRRDQESEQQARTDLTGS